MSSDIPAAPEVLQEYFGQTDYGEVLKVWESRRSDAHEQLSESTVDLSLFPYYAQGPFETPVPTPAEIVASRDESSVGTVWRIGPYTIKASLRIEILQEAENLIFLEKNSDVRVPKVYAAFSTEDTGLYDLAARGHYEWYSKNPKPHLGHYLIMETMGGISLKDIHKSNELEEEEHLKMKIGKLLGQQLRKLRSVVPEDPNHFGRVKGKPYRFIPPIYHPPAPDYNNWGPFNYEQLIDRLIQAAKVDNAWCTCFPEDYNSVTRQLFRDAKSTLLNQAKSMDRIPTLSHMDVTDSRVLVQFVRDGEGKPIDVEEVVLVDWLDLCWMPSWFEAAEMYRLFVTPFEFDSIVAHEAFRAMGDVNMVITAFFAVCLHERAFYGRP